MAKTANLYARIEPEVKEAAETILSALGIPVSNAINMFYKQIILQKGLPFAVKLPSTTMLTLENMTEEQLSVELEKGYMDMQNGDTVPLDRVFSDIRKDYNI